MLIVTDPDLLILMSPFAISASSGLGQLFVRPGNRWISSLLGSALLL